MLCSITIGTILVSLVFLGHKLPFGSVKFENIFGAKKWSLTECSVVFESIWKCSCSRVTGEKRTIEILEES